MKERTTKKQRERYCRRVRDRRRSSWWDSWAGVSGVKLRPLSHRQCGFFISASLKTQQPKLCLNLTFQKHRLIRRSLLSLLLPCATHHFLPLSALFHLFPFISLSYSCHISPTPNLFLSIAPLLYFSLLLSLVMYLFLLATLLHSVSLHIRCG